MWRTKLRQGQLGSSSSQQLFLSPTTLLSCPSPLTRRPKLAKCLASQCAAVCCVTSLIDADWSRVGVVIAVTHLGPATLHTRDTVPGPQEEHPELWGHLPSLYLALFFSSPGDSKKLRPRQCRTTVPVCLSR